MPTSRPRSTARPAETLATAAPQRPGEEILVSPELQAALDRLEQAQSRFLDAAMAFCDGSISAGQLRAVRELLREQDLQVTRLSGRQVPPFVEPPAEPELRPLLASDRPAAAEAPPEPAAEGPEEMAAQLTALDRKLARVEEDFAQGRINPTQYQAIRRHYLEQREVALKLHASNPASDRWRVVLEEGMTVFLLQLNEAVCRGFALYDVETRDRIFLEGAMGRPAEEAMALLGTFGPAPGGAADGRMLATRADDGTSLLLIPGRQTAALAIFSQDPPGWQVRALREVHRNFEVANQAALARGERRSLVFPDLSRIVKPAGDAD